MNVFAIKSNDHLAISSSSTIRFDGLTDEQAARMLADHTEALYKDLEELVACLHADPSADAPGQVAASPDEIQALKAKFDSYRS